VERGIQMKAIMNYVVIFLVALVVGCVVGITIIVPKMTGKVINIENQLMSMTAKLDNVIAPRLEQMDQIDAKVEEVQAQLKLIRDPNSKLGEMILLFKDNDILFNKLFKKSM
jgi:predicted nuclease with TOPRIM domain